MSEKTERKRRKNRGRKSWLTKLVSFSPIWVFPVAAIAIGLSLLWKEYTTSGIPIIVKFPSAAGIEVKKTQVKFRGVTAGTVTGLSMNPDFSLDVMIEMDRRAAPILVEDTSFWLVKPNISANGISGLDTLLSGAYITLKPGDSRQQVRYFEALKKQPSLIEDEDDLRIQLAATDLGSLKIGSPIFYKKIPVGKITGYHLASQNREVIIQAAIDESYAHLVNKDSIFWNTGNIKVDTNLSGIQVTVDSFMTLLTGGISFTNPTKMENKTNNRKVNENHIYKLHDSYRMAKAGSPFLVKSAWIDAESLKNLVIRKDSIEIGYIDNPIPTIQDKKTTDTVLQAYIDPKYDFILKEGTEFWLESPKFEFGAIFDWKQFTSGSYVTFSQSDQNESAPDKKLFDLLQGPSQTKKIHGYTSFYLISSERYNLTVGSLIYYQEETIGQVSSIKFDKERLQYNIKVQIDDSYKNILGAHSFFHMNTAVVVKGGLRGFRAEVGSLSEAFVPSIRVFADRSNKASKRKQFTLYKNKDQGLYSHQFTLELEDASGLIPGVTKIVWKGKTIGQVMDLKANVNQDNLQLVAGIKPSFSKLLNTSAHFYVNKPSFSLSGIKGLESLVSGPEIHLTAKLDAPAKHTFTLRESSSKVFLVRVTWPAETPPSLGAKVSYNGFTIGSVLSVELSKSLEDMTVALAIDDKYKVFGRKGSKFWLKKPSVSLDGIKNPSAYLSGPSIGAWPGDGERIYSFKGLLAPYSKVEQTDSVVFKLTSDARHSLRNGSPVTYRQIQVGKITVVDLNDDASGVEIHGHIFPKYGFLLNKTSKFWLTTGVNLDFGLFSGLNVRTDSLESILAGGIALATEDFSHELTTTQKQSFVLHQEPEEEWLSWSPTRPKAQQEFAH
ncbi:MAG: MCE family protein [Pseudobacteriovorax sp.]|nr:MCE family protein [Pseudobacteriovorax sp.]